ncbi:hypothetical protein BGZ90_008686, partial [Linnemannia elongata]
DDTPVSKFSEAEKVVIKAEPQEPKISIVDDVEDMAVKENPRDDEIVVLKVVKAVQKEKDKVQEKAPSTRSTSDNNNSSISRSGTINNTNSTIDSVTKQDEDVLRAGELMAGERGDAETQFRVGSMYRRGQGIPQSNAKSRKWYLRAAEGHSNAQFKLGMLLENGALNVAKDLVTAVDWSYKAANHGHPRLSSNLAAAEHGVELAQLAVGIQYHQGRFRVSSDCVKALTWFSKVAEKGNADAQHLIGLTYYSGGRNISRNFTRAMEWFLRAANNRRGMHLGALHRIGSLYREGLGVERDWAKAKEWYLKATTAEPKKDDKEMDYTEAMTWFLNVAKVGDVEAHYQIGLCYEQGHLNGERNESAMEWFRLATARGYRQAQERADKQGYAEVQCGNGLLYHLGGGLQDHD